MQKRSHALLARTLLTQVRGFHKKRFELAFLLGSFQPDCNPLTYLKGSRTGKPLMGHNFSNSRAYVTSRILRLQRRDRWSVWQYYTLGKLTHYLADAFTFPHNDTYTDSLQEHRRYEAALRRQLSRRLTQLGEMPVSLPRDPAEALDRLHRRYLTTASDLHRDIDYILEATSLLMAALRPEPSGTSSCRL